MGGLTCEMWRRRFEGVIYMVAVGDVARFLEGREGSEGLCKEKDSTKPIGSRLDEFVQTPHVT